MSSRNFEFRKSRCLQSRRRRRKERVIAARRSGGVGDFIYINPREIWFAKIGQNIGFEEKGKDNFLRPVLILKKIVNLFFTAALTIKGKDNNFYHKISDVELHNPKHKNSSYVILSQVKVIDKKRYTEKIGNVPKKEFGKIKEKLKTVLF